MAKKVFLTTMFAVLFILALTRIGFAESSNMTTKLGNEVTSSMNKTEKGMDDLSHNNDLDEAGQALKDGVRETGNTIRNGMEDIKNGVEDLGDEDNSRRTENKAVAGTTGNYTAGQIQADTTTESNNGMTRNAWIWIVMAVVALIIIAAVWYYATQQK